MSQDKIEVRDSRDGKFFWIDRAALEQICDLYGARGVAVYAWLCNHANQKTQECYPSISRIADKCKMNRHTVIELIRCFEKDGIIAADRNHGSKTIYKLLEIKTSASRGTGAPTSTGASVSTGTGAPRGTGTGASGGTGTTIIQQQSINNKPTAGNGSATEGPSAQLKAAFKAVKEKGLNIYALMNKFRNESRLREPLPEKVLIGVCDSFMRNSGTIKNNWGWFLGALEDELAQYFAQRNINEHKQFKTRPATVLDIVRQLAAKLKV